MKVSDTKIIEAIDKNGGRHLGLVIVCRECDSDSFHITKFAHHQHIVCTQCYAFYCDGTCDHANTKRKS